ncbi:wall-associated kinase, putative [Medicago truncatula]|uniref:Wall-associated kinase, putative n=1 Tax=Medicago truncatula TaxID=3880 RepID=G7L2Z1_MEDTR|nr:wall-associated kinase, putative [Medicago truncatula]
MFKKLNEYGCTSRGSRNCMLVYGYVSNGTVANHLHGNKTTRALKHLHASNDIKTRNNPLDIDFHAKVRDFLLSHDLLTDQSHIPTGAQGTKSYLDPEYS